MNKNFSFPIGRMAALSIAVATTVFAISLIWEVINLSEFAKNLGYVAIIFIAISVVIMMACFYDVTGEQLKIFGVLALVSSIIYAPLCIGTYFLQLSTVQLNPLNLSSEVLKGINFKPGSAIFVFVHLGRWIRIGRNKRQGLTSIVLFSRGACGSHNCVTNH